MAYYDWTLPEPFTDAPEHAPLRCGNHQMVLLNGKDAGPVTRCKTGENGWVERYRRGPDGQVLYDFEAGEALRETFYGKVEYRLR